MKKVYFIATKHKAYESWRPDPGSVVIDPWRYLPDIPDVRVRRLGQNKPALISVLVPSRGRPEWLSRMLTSLYATAAHARFVEVICWLDEDDPQFTNYWRIEQPVSFISGSRTLLSDCWNNCAAVANGEIFMHCGDDVTFNTPGWDQQVRDAFAASADKILFAYGDDLGPHGKELGTHGFVHRNWVNAVGYFLPPLFSSDWNDIWLNEVAKMVRRHKLLGFVTEHHHYAFGKAPRDKTHAEREERGERDDVAQLYRDTEDKRKQDAARLKAVMV